MDLEVNNPVLINGDCIEEMAKLPDNSIDLCLTDPPYKIVTGGMKSGFSHKTGNIFKNSSDGNLFKYHSVPICLWMGDFYRVLKNDAQAYVFVNDKNMRDYLNFCHKTGFKLQNILVWRKNNKVTSRAYMKDCEYILFLRKGAARTIYKPSTPTVLEFKNVKNKIHPTEKPVSLIECLIENSSKANEIVFDPFMGGGSTGVAAKNLNRKFIGIEKDEAYFKIAQDRINQSQCYNIPTQAH